MIKSKKLIKDRRRQIEMAAQLEQHRYELEHEGPNGIGAVVNGGTTIEYWDGSKEIK